MNRKDIAAGAFFVSAGAGYGGMALATLSIGNATSMGGGYFPIMLGLTLVSLGIIIGVRGCYVAGQSPFGNIPWRGIILLSVATILFATFLDELGLLPSVFVLTLISSFANSKVEPFQAVAVSLCIALFCTAIFSYGVRLPIPVIGPLFGVNGI